VEAAQHRDGDQLASGRRAALRYWRLAAWALKRPRGVVVLPQVLSHQALEMPLAQHEGRNRTHERQDSTYSEMKEIAQERPDRISGVHRCHYQNQEGQGGEA